MNFSSRFSSARQRSKIPLIEAFFVGDDVYHPLCNLEHSYDLEITHESNAIEGNRLSPVETTLVIEKEVAISKPVGMRALS